MKFNYPDIYQIYQAALSYAKFYNEKASVFDTIVNGIYSDISICKVVLWFFLRNGVASYITSITINMI